MRKYKILSSGQLTTLDNTVLWQQLENGYFIAASINALELGDKLYTHTDLESFHTCFYGTEDTIDSSANQALEEDLEEYQAYARNLRHRILRAEQALKPIQLELRALRFEHSRVQDRVDSLKMQLFEKRPKKASPAKKPADVKAQTMLFLNTLTPEQKQKLLEDFKGK